LRFSRRSGLYSFLGLGLVGVLAALASCSSSKVPEQNNPVPGPGEQCVALDQQPPVQIHIHPAFVAVAPGKEREVDVQVEPDFCKPAKLTFSVDSPGVVAAPKAQRIDLVTPGAKIVLKGLKAGKATLTASIPSGDGTDSTATLPIEVTSADIPACSGSGSGKLDDGVTVRGTGGLVGASIGLQKGATKPNSGSFLWHVDPFDVTLACAKDQVPKGFTRLGPAVTFAPADMELKREIPFTLPVDLAAMPPKARLRHVTVSYSGPHAKAPRAIPIADPRFVHDEHGYQLYFMAPWLGTYQAIVKSDAGTVTFKRHLTHRALIGVSMGGGGSAMDGLRNHQKFDVVAPLGGPVDWTWMLGYIERNHMGGFLPNDGTNVPTQLAPMPAAPLPYEHPCTFDQWWYEYPKNGNGGSFPRSEYVQIFRDLALMFGNPNSYNPAPNAENLPAGVPPTDKSVVGDHPGNECAVYVDPISGDPNEAKQQELAKDCPVERCKHTLVLHNYYDDEFNPKGTFPVITVCDGSPQDPSLTPYANTWSPTGDDSPLELALAVDYNNNGVRDQNEPLIRDGHEPFDDVGIDGKADKDEPGYKAGVNDDPDGDDYNPQYNPSGTEGNWRYDKGEPFKDYGLDGVPNTKQSPYDYGEGNGKFDMSPGYATFLKRDSRSILEQLPIANQKEPLDDAALQRLDVWSDGGTRDLFNFAVDAQALAGSLAERGRIVHYYTSWDRIPGQLWGTPNQFQAGLTDWGAVPGAVLLRYGKIDPTPADIESGTGQHVGTADDIARRLQEALYYIGSRWPDAPRTLDETSAQNPDPNAPTCEVQLSCKFNFTDSRGRTGPVGVNLPPGYANEANKDKRYPVVYVMHGYGQTPEDLTAFIAFIGNWMNSPLDSTEMRLPKAIMVYVDGRCRPGKDEAECIRGTFFTDSVRKNGPKMEGWFDDLMAEIDKRYRTMGPSDIDWTE
jgi:hypothetical protein